MMSKKMISIGVMLCFLCCTLLSGCETVKNYRKSFYEYYSKDEVHDTLFDCNGFPIEVLSIEKENVSNHPRVVVLLDFGISDNGLGPSQYSYDFAKLPVSSQKDILRSFCEKVIDYSKDSKWKNDYYLYVNLHCGYGSVVYDYELDWLYVPVYVDIYLSMYESYGSFYYKDLEDKEGGKEFLLQNGLCREKHGELEPTFSDSSFSVYIDNDGKFQSYAEDGSVCYRDITLADNFP